jgi:hypothetical protein
MNLKSEFVPGYLINFAPSINDRQFETILSLNKTMDHEIAIVISSRHRLSVVLILVNRFRFGRQVMN